MSFLKRLGYYLGGFSAGLIFLAFILNGKKTQCNYSPDARVLNDLSKKDWIYSPKVKPFFLLDSITIAVLVKEGDINFSASKTKRDSCKIYTLETKIGLKEYDLEVENCSKKATVLSVSLLE
tara:strand:+ start:6513 stop:6878 length:366 start_codon:yes stop_codon:yes gene_type:complete